MDSQLRLSELVAKSVLLSLSFSGSKTDLAQEAQRISWYSLELQSNLLVANIPRMNSFAWSKSKLQIV